MVPTSLQILNFRRHPSDTQQPVWLRLRQKSRCRCVLNCCVSCCGEKAWRRQFWIKHSRWNFQNNQKRAALQIRPPAVTSYRICSVYMCVDDIFWKTTHALTVYVHCTLGNRSFIFITAQCNNHSWLYGRCDIFTAVILDLLGLHHSAYFV